MIQPSIWLSFDIEATGPMPGLHSMLSLGISAWLDVPDKGAERFEKLGTFSENIRELDYCVWDKDTKGWWASPEQSTAFFLTTEHPSEPKVAMERMMEFLESLPHHPHIWAAYPAAFDMPFVRYYAQRFIPEQWCGFYGSPLERIACFDMGSLAMHLLACGYHDVSKKRMPSSWTSFDNPCPHVALNDAEEQAHLLKAMLRESRARRSGG